MKGSQPGIEINFYHVAQKQLQNDRFQQVNSKSSYHLLPTKTLLVLP